MIFSFSATALVSIILICVTFLFAFVVWNRRPTRGAVAFSVFILLVSCWMLFRTFSSAAVDWEVKVTLGKCAYLFLAGSAVWWLVFALDFSGVRVLKKKLTLLLLSLLPLVSVILVTISGWFHIAWLNLSPILTVEGEYIVWSRGLLWWTQLIYLLLLLLSGYAVLWKFAFTRQSALRRQVWYLLIGTLVPVVGMVLFAYGVGFYRGLDILMITLTVGIVIFALTIFRLRFLDVVPVARGALVERIPDGIMVLNNHRVVQDINPAVERILKVSKDSAVGSPLSRVWPQLDVIFDKLKPGRNIEITADQRILDLSLTGLTDNRAKLVGRLIVLRDVTEKKLMEQNLRESEAMYETLVEQSNEMVVIVQDGIIKFANEPSRQIVGLNPAEAVGRPFLSLVAEEDREMVDQRYRLRLEGCEVPSIYEFNVKRNDSELRELEASLGIITFEEKRALIATARDVTERKLTQRKLESLYREEKHLRNSLEAEIEKRGKYTRALVHELNTPLTSILASGELLESEIKDPAATGLVQNIRASSYNLKQRIDELIELARGETGILKINAMPIDISRLLVEVEQEIEPLVKRKGLEIRLDIEPDIPLVMGDYGRLRQVVYNLISNALKYTSAGRIEVRAEQSGDFVLISVRDSGRGISSEELATLFDPYRRRTEDRETGELGIGLTLSKMFVELHGGRMEVESEEGKGSTFRFSVPLYRESDLIKKFTTPAD